MLVFVLWFVCFILERRSLRVSKIHKKESMWAREWSFRKEKGLYVLPEGGKRERVAGTGFNFRKEVG